MVLATGMLHRRWVCACSELTCALSFAIGVRSQGSFDAEEVCGSVDDETKPELLLALGEAPSSLSIDLSLSHRRLELLSSMQSHATSLPALTTALIINCVSGRPNCTGNFQCRSMNEHATPRSLSSVFGRVGAGVAQLGVSRRGRRFVVCASRSLRGAKKHPTAVILGTFVSIRVPARLPLVSTACALR